MLPQIIMNQFIQNLFPLEERVQRITRYEPFKFEKGELWENEFGNLGLTFFGRLPFDFKNEQSLSRYLGEPSGLSLDKIKFNYYGLDYRIVWLDVTICPHSIPLQKNGSPAFWVGATWATDRYGRKLFRCPYDPITGTFIDPEDLPTVLREDGERVYKMLSGSQSPFLDTAIDVLEGVDSNPLKKGMVWTLQKGVEILPAPEKSCWGGRWLEHAKGYENKSFKIKMDHLFPLLKMNVFQRPEDWQEQVGKWTDEMLGKRKTRKKLKIDPFKDDPFLCPPNTAKEEHLQTVEIAPNLKLQVTRYAQVVEFELRYKNSKDGWGGNTETAIKIDSEKAKELIQALQTV